MARFGLMLAAGLAAGCHAPACIAPVAPAAPQLPLVPRGTVEPDVSALPTEPSTLRPRPEQYRGLTAAECRALAVRNAPLASDLDSHPENRPPGRHVGKKESDLAQVSRLVRGYAADELRNRAAGDALDLYYKLAAAEGRFDLAVAAHRVLRDQLADVLQAIKAGAANQAAAESIRRQILELESQIAKLEAGITGLNAGLAGHLGLDPADPTPIWPSDPLRVGGEVPDAEQAVQTGMQYRPDLNLLRTLSANAERGGELANAVLTSVNPLLGSTDPANPLVALLAVLKQEPTRAEAKLHGQVDGLLRTRERQADAEIRAAVAELRGARASAGAKAAEVRNLQARVKELETRRAAGENVTAELIAARLDLLKQRGELIQSAADWHAGDVKLRRVTGLLVRE